MLSQLHTIHHRCLLTVIGLTLLLTAQAHAGRIISTNDLALNIDTGVYKVVGNDPFLLFEPVKNSNGRSRFLIFDTPLRSESTRVQLFFKHHNQAFSSQHIIEFTAPNHPFKLKIPESVSLNINLLRLDINNCHDCSFTFKSAELSSYSTSEEPVIEADQFQNGSLSINANTGLALDISNWTMNDVQGVPTAFTVDGLDPYMASERLNVSSVGLGGVYFRFSQPNDSEHSNYQFFYATENNPFTAQYSSIARLAPIRNAQTSSSHESAHEVEIMFPLAYLNLETPRDQVLKRVRLDFPVIKGNWSLIESKLIHSQQLPLYQQHIPKQLLQQKRQRLTGRTLIKKAFQNILNDKAFILFLALLLFSIISLAINAYRK